MAAINTPFTGVRLSKYPYRSLEMASETPKGLLSGAETVVII